MEDLLLRGFEGEIQYDENIVDIRIWFWRPGSSSFSIRIFKEAYLEHYKSLMRRKVDIKLMGGLTLEDRVSVIRTEDKSENVKTINVSFEAVLAIENVPKKDMPESDMELSLAEALSAIEINGVIVSEPKLSTYCIL
jgi:hypothetical protein